MPSPNPNVDPYVARRAVRVVKGSDGDEQRLIVVLPPEGARGGLVGVVTGRTGPSVMSADDTLRALRVGAGLPPDGPGQPRVVRRVSCPVCGYVTRACKAAVPGFALVAQHRIDGARNDCVPYCSGTHDAIPIANDEVVGR